MSHCLHNAQLIHVVSLLASPTQHLLIQCRFQICVAASENGSCFHRGAKGSPAFQSMPGKSSLRSCRGCAGFMPINTLRRSCILSPPSMLWCKVCASRRVDASLNYFLIDLYDPPAGKTCRPIHLPLREVVLELLDGACAPRFNALSVPSAAAHGQNNLLL